jgi:type 1 glutamine amidotransferase
MSKYAGFVVAAAAAAAFLATWGVWAGEPAAPAPAAGPLRALVIAGGHGYAEKEFPKAFEGHADIACTFFTEKVGGEAYEDISKWDYQAIVLYNFNRKISQTQQKNLLQLLDRGVGLFIMHHAVAAYPEWPEFWKILGGRYYLKETAEGGVTHPRSIYKHDVDFKIHIEDPRHPVTAGLSDYPIHDETYGKYTVAPSVHVILTTDEPTAEKAVGWVHTYGKARVCFIQSGHDDKAYVNPAFKQLTAQAIRWTAGRLPQGDLAPSNYKPRS